MKKWNILVLDLSASMTYNKSMLVKGYNTLINDQKTQGSRDKFTVIGFNTETKIIKNEFFPDVSSISNEDFVTQGCTALLDTVGYVYDIILDNSEYDDIIITVITDGMENSSKIYTYDMLNQKRKEIDKHYNIEFLFIGSDISCLQKNVVLSHVSQSINYDGDILKALNTASRSISSYRQGSTYIPENMVNISISETSSNENITNAPIIKRQHSTIDPPYITNCKKICRLF